MARQNEFSYKIQFGNAFIVGFLLFWCFIWAVLCLILSAAFGAKLWLHWLVGGIIGTMTLFLTQSLVFKRARYGHVRLDMAQIPYQRGEQSEARIVFPKELPDLHVDVELRCFRRSTVWERNSDGESTSRETRSYLYQQSLPTQSTVQGGITCFPVSFVMPAEHPPSSNGTARGWKWRPTQADGVVWSLEVKGPDFKVELELPAFEVADSAHIRRPV